MPKLTYFDIGGRAEFARQAFAIAGVAFEDNRCSFAEFAEMKAAGKFEFGSVPVLELDDGTSLSQSMPILRYVCKQFGGDKIQQNGDALAEWNADSLVAYWTDDFIGKNLPPTFFQTYVFPPNASTAERDAEYEKVLAKVPDALAKMEARFAKVDTKFLLGDKPSSFDIVIGASFSSHWQIADDDKMTVFKNGFQAILGNGSYPKTKAFSDNYKALLTDYLAARKLLVSENILNSIFKKTNT